MKGIQHKLAFGDKIKLDVLRLANFFHQKTFE